MVVVEITNVVRCIRLTKRKRELHNGEYAFNIDPRREYPLKERSNGHS
ncbi:MAG: hypothetical protein N2V77_06845 [Canidatus Methanoxibalbensis ujae]|nr:hypothetical protein [Candidatus Methanoxibalbensis ujae]